MSEKSLEKINKEREKEGEPPFANPRNAAAGSIRQLDPNITRARKLDNFIYDIAQLEGAMPVTQEAELTLLEKLGFKVNPHCEKFADIKGVEDLHDLLDDFFLLDIPFFAFRIFRSRAAIVHIAMHVSVQLIFILLARRDSRSAHAA